MTGTVYTILYLEDDSNDVLLFEHALARSSLPCHVHSVASITQARQYLLTEPPYADLSTFPRPDLILTDIVMNSESGFDFIAWLRTASVFDHLPVVCLTGSNDPRALARLAALQIAIARKTPLFDQALQAVRQALHLAE